MNYILRLVPNLFLIFFLFHSPVQASIAASLSRNPIYLDETTDLIINLDSSSEESLRFPLRTEIYDVVARQSSSNITVINNRFTQSKVLAYTLKFKRSGIFTLPIRDINSTNPNTYLQIKVLDTNPQSKMTESKLQMGNSSYASKRHTPFALVSVTNDRPYLNEQILFKLKVFHRGELRQIQLPDFNLSSFIHERAEKSREYTENLNGENYYVYELTYKLYPLKSGTANIPATNILVSVLEENENNFDPFDPFTSFNRSLLAEAPRTLKTNNLNLEVKAIPTAPKGFTGYVGELNLKHKSNGDSIKAGEPFSIFTEISGNGNPNNLKLKELFYKSDSYSVYQDKAKRNNYMRDILEHFQINLTNAIIINQSKTELEVKSKALVYFNPKTKNFETIPETSFKLKVLGGSTDKKAVTAEDKNTKKAKRQNPKIISNKSIYTYKASLFNLELPYRLAFNFNNYLIYILLSLNFLFLGPRLISKLFSKISKIKSEKYPFSNYEKLIQASKLITEISSLLKKLYLEIDTKQSIENKLSKLDLELFEEFNRLIEQTDKINYGLINEPDEKITKAIREEALRVLKGLKKLYG